MHYRVYPLGAHLAKCLVGMHLSDCCSFQEVKIRVNAWADRQDRKSSHCREVATVEVQL